MNRAVKGRVEVGSNDCAGPAEHLRMSGICPKQFLQKKNFFGEKVWFVIDLPPFHHIDYFEVLDHNQL